MVKLTLFHEKLLVILLFMLVVVIYMVDVSKKISLVGLSSLY